MSTHKPRFQYSAPRHQRGITTLAITLILLVILTLMVVFSTNVGFFEQRTATNENRALITEQMAEYALNLSGELLKANRGNIISNKAGSGWFETGATRWIPCPVFVANSPHPCDAERLAARRAQMYYYDNDNDPTTGLPYATMAAARSGTGNSALTGDGNTRFSGTTTVNALLCRIEYDLTNPTVPVPECKLNPAGGRDVALTLIADAALTNEQARSTVKETWATVGVPMPTAAVPLVASGTVEGLGSGNVVAAPNAGGYGVAATIWSPEEVDIGDTAPGCSGSPGIGSFLTCHLGEYLQTTPREQLLTTSGCADSGSPCGCPAMSVTGEDSLSGHDGAIKREVYDVLDVDGGCGSPDITFFPLETRTATPPFATDKPNDPTDDSLFEYTFNVGYVVDEGATMVNNNCGASGAENCAVFALQEFGAITLPDCSSLDTASAGIFYVTGDCDVGNFGSPTNTVIVVVDGDVAINGGINFYGMLFARSDDAATTAVRVTGSGSPKIFGALLVEGGVRLTGSPHLIYQDVSASSGAYGGIPPNVRFGKVSGSWLDNRVGI